MFESERDTGTSRPWEADASASFESEISGMRALRNMFARPAAWMVAAGCFAFAIVSGAAEGVREFPARAAIRFAGSSTLHDFGGQLPAQPFLLAISNGAWSASANVLSAQMATGGEKRDGKMHQMLGTNAFPRMSGTVVGASLPVNEEADAILNLTIRDTARDLPVRITGWKESSSRISFHAEWIVSLKAYGLNPPSVIGVIRVADSVKLAADVTADKTGSSPFP
jgi:hypothetical protein